jgi:hypothetical protein
MVIKMHVLLTILCFCTYRVMYILFLYKKNSTTESCKIFNSDIFPISIPHLTVVCLFNISLPILLHISSKCTVRNMREVFYATYHLRLNFKSV